MRLPTVSGRCLCVVLFSLLCLCDLQSVAGSGRFKTVLASPLEVLAGEQANFEWEYVLDGSTSIFLGKWGRLIPSGGGFESPFMMIQRADTTTPQVVSTNTRFALRTQSFSNAGMRISNVNQEDEGSFRCTLTLSDFTDISSTVQLIVLVRPVIGNQTQALEVDEGNPIVLLCGVTAGNPRPFTFFWKQDDTVLQSKVHANSFNLELTNVSRFTVGRYECSAANKAGTDTYSVEVTVRYKPVVTVPLGDKVIQENGTTSLFCVADGYPTPITYAWFQDTALTNPVVENSNFALTENNQRLSFNNAVESMSGDYFCVATNIKGAGLPARGFLDVTFGPRSISIAPTGNVIQVLEHVNQTIKCQADANPPALYTWSKEGLGFTSTSSGELQLIMATKEDSGKYLCTAANSIGMVTQEVTVDVRYAPKNTKLIVNASMGTYVGIKGNPINMTCSADGNPSPAYSIRLAGTGSEISTGPGYYYIANAQETHEDTYDCIATNPISPVGTASLQIILAVTPEISHLRLNPLSPLGVGAVMENTVVTLECNVIARPVPGVAWRFDGTALANDSVRTITTAVTGARGRETIVLSKIVFDRVRRVDEGIYECGTSNFAGSIKQEFVLDVKFLPRVLADHRPKNDTVHQLETAGFSCRAEGDPNVDAYQWKHNGQVLAGETAEVLTLSNVNAASAGVYSCAGHNSFGFGEESNAVLVVQYPPRIDFMPQNMLVNATNSVLVHCNASGVPTPLVQWFKEDHLVAAGNSLSIAIATYKDKGFYLCTASNKFGSDNTTFRLEVQHAPVITTTTPSFTKLGINNGEDAPLICTVNALPSAQITWKLGTAVVVSTAGKYQIDTSANTSTLMVLAVAQADMATYSCETINSFGAASQNYEITQKGRPEPPVSGTLQVQDTLQFTVPPSVSVRFSWVTGFNGGYEIEMDILYREFGDSVFQEVLIGNPAGSTYDLPKLKPGTDYEFTMRARNQEGSSGNYQPIVRHMTQVAPQPRGTTKLTKTGPGSVNVSWVASEPLSLAEVQVRYKHVQAFTWISMSTSATNKSLMISGLDPELSYEIQVIFAYLDGSTGVPIVAGHVLARTSTKPPSKLEEEEIIAIVVGSGGFILVLIVIIALCCVRRKKKEALHKSTPIELTHGSNSRSLSGYTPGGADVVRSNYVTDDVSYSTEPVRNGKKDSPPPSYNHHQLGEGPFYNDGFNDSLTTSFQPPNAVGSTPAYASFSKDAAKARRERGTESSNSSSRAAEISRRRLDDYEDGNDTGPAKQVAGYDNLRYSTDSVDNLPQDDSKQQQPFSPTSKVAFGEGAFYNPQSTDEVETGEDVDDLDLDLPMAYHGVRPKPPAASSGLSTDDEFSDAPKSRQPVPRTRPPRDQRVPGSLSSTAAGRGNKKSKHAHTLGAPVLPPLVPEHKKDFNHQQSSPASSHSGVSSRPYISDNEYVEPEDANYVGYLV